MIVAIYGYNDMIVAIYGYNWYDCCYIWLKWYNNFGDDKKKKRKMGIISSTIAGPVGEVISFLNKIL